MCGSSTGAVLSLEPPVKGKEAQSIIDNRVLRLRVIGGGGGGGGGDRTRE